MHQNGAQGTIKSRINDIFTVTFRTLTAALKIRHDERRKKNKRIEPKRSKKKKTKKPLGKYARRRLNAIIN